MQNTEHNMSVKRPEKYPPHGMEAFDLEALSDDQQVALTSFKVINISSFNMQSIL